MIKTHFPYDPRYKTVIHILRDPRDIIVSHYYYVRRALDNFFHASDRTFEKNEFVDSFLSGGLWPCDLRTHTESFAMHEPFINYFLINYERLLLRSREVFRRLLGYFKIDLTVEEIDGLIRHTTFKNMSRLSDPFSKQQRGMLRKGIVGGYRKELSKESIRKNEGIYGDYLTKYGYSE